MPQYEDIIMKKAMETFATDGLKFLGIEEKITEIGSTELVVLEAKNLSMDYTFLTEKDYYLHFEFQTTNKGVQDLRRFWVYEALLTQKTGKEVITYVVYSGDIIDPQTVLKSGINEYRVKAITLAKRDGDSVIARLQDKCQAHQLLNRDELIELAFTPVMGGQLSKADKITAAIRLTRAADEDEAQLNTQAILYAFASKFLKGQDLEQVKEEIRMTELGKMIYNDGKLEGRAEGRAEGRVEGRAEGMETRSLQIAESLLDLLTDEVIAEKTSLDLAVVKKMRAERLAAAN